ncbi:MAG: helix-turn-helix domain-containing protein [Polyangia bacterium]|nr:helix-turn-helix domain-containing protein [Polyangia bacterium]
MLTQWDKIKAAERMQAHIEAHLGDKITMAALARAARYSQWHAARVFKEVTGKSPFEYVRLRRLSAAAQELQKTSRKVVDVAFDFVFDSHEGFTRAFARQFGRSPRSFRETGSTAELFMPPQLRDFYTRRQRGEEAMPENKKPDTVPPKVLGREGQASLAARHKVLGREGQASLAARHEELVRVVF